MSINESYNHHYISVRINPKVFYVLRQINVWKGALKVDSTKILQLQI